MYLLTFKSEKSNKWRQIKKRFVKNERYLIITIVLLLSNYGRQHRFQWHPIGCPPCAFIAFRLKTARSSIKFIICDLKVIVNLSQPVQAGSTFYLYRNSLRATWYAAQLGGKRVRWYMLTGRIYPKSWAGQATDSALPRWMLVWWQLRTCLQ